MLTGVIEYIKGTLALNELSSDGAASYFVPIIMHCLYEYSREALLRNNFYGAIKR